MKCILNKVRPFEVMVEVMVDVTCEDDAHGLYL